MIYKIILLKTSKNFFQKKNRTNLINFLKNKFINTESDVILKEKVEIYGKELCKEFSYNIQYQNQNDILYEKILESILKDTKDFKWDDIYNIYGIIAYNKNKKEKESLQKSFKLGLNKIILNEYYLYIHQVGQEFATDDVTFYFQELECFKDNDASDLFEFIRTQLELKNQYY